MAQEPSPLLSRPPQAASALSGDDHSEQKLTTKLKGNTAWRIFVDPQTGATRQEPSPGTAPLQLSEDERKANSTSHAGLFEVPSSVPGGGFIVDLQGRFNSPQIETVDSNGKIRTLHLKPLPRQSAIEK